MECALSLDGWIMYSLTAKLLTLFIPYDKISDEYLSRKKKAGLAPPLVVCSGLELSSEIPPRRPSARAGTGCALAFARLVDSQASASHVFAI